MAPPAQMEALVTADVHRAEVKLVPVPKLESNEILVKVLNVTLNPTDWKHIAFLAQPGYITGCDFCGVVEEVAPDAKGNVKVGDKVAGFVHGGKYPDRGSFAQYLKTSSELVMKVPEGISNDTASSVAVAGETAALALFDRLGLKYPEPSKGLPEITKDSPALLVWAGSTAVGQYAIQLGRAAGYRVITTASPKNHELLKSMGAFETHDYRDESTPEKIAKAHPDLSLALDCISENGTQSLCVRSLGEKGGEIIVLLKPEEDAIKLRNDVKITHILAYTCLGRPFSYGKAEFGKEIVEKDSAFIKKWLNGDQGVFYHLFKNKLISGNKIKHLEGGLRAIPEGLKYLQEGKVSGEKLAFTIDVL
ncbi:Zinc-binding oxidoreductase alcohol dehydrogenase [Thecaphora frezii]